MSAEKRLFGPFADVPAEDIKPAGFTCLDCRKPVERAAMAHPAVVVRMIFYACQCGAVAVFEDERQPSGSRHWRNSVELLKSSGAGLVIFNGNRPLKPDFSGLN